MNSGAASSPRSRRALRPVHWRSRIVIAGRRCEISKVLRQRSSAIRFPACQRSTGENANGLTDESRPGLVTASRLGRARIGTFDSTPAAACCIYGAQCCGACVPFPTARIRKKHCGAITRRLGATELLRRGGSPLCANRSQRAAGVATFSPLNKAALLQALAIGAQAFRDRIRRPEIRSPASPAARAPRAATQPHRRAA
jgi:hypothetical protein